VRKFLAWVAGASIPLGIIGSWLVLDWRERRRRANGEGGD
jgi:hypothetical protein